MAQPAIDQLPDDDKTAADHLQGKVDALRGTRCTSCPAVLCGHEILLAVALGFARQPRCLTCLAQEIQQGRASLRDHLWRHFQQRECYQAVWRRESEVEAHPDLDYPACLWPSGPARATPAIVGNSGSEMATGAPTAAQVSPHDVDQPADAEWDAGSMACGELVLMLRMRLRELTPGAVLRLVATDTAAAQDIPAWCRLTGNPLLAARRPVFWIQRGG